MNFSIFQFFGHICSSGLAVLAGSKHLDNIPVLWHPFVRPQPAVFDRAGPVLAGKGVVCVVSAVWACLPCFSLFLAEPCFRLVSLSSPVFQPSSCRYSGTLLPSVLYNANGTLIGGTLYLVFGSPVFWLSTITLFVRYCYSVVLVAFVLHFADSPVIGIVNTLYLQAPFF